MPESFGKLAYNTFVSTLTSKGPYGIDEFFVWEDLLPEQRTAWYEAAWAVVNATRKTMKYDATPGQDTSNVAVSEYDAP